MCVKSVVTNLIKRLEANGSRYRFHISAIDQDKDIGRNAVYLAYIILNCRLDRQ